MAVGRITGPLLKANLLREGVPLAFETDLLYLDVINGRIGVKTSAPQFDLDVNGTTRTTNLKVDTQTTIGVDGVTDVFTIAGNTIATSNNILYLQPSGVNPVVYQGKLTVNNNLQLTTNTISTTVTNANLNVNTLGTGQVNINSNVLVNGDLHATGTITADGNINLGNATSDNVVFNADVNSNIIPDVTDTYSLGSDPTTGGHAWKNAYLQTVQATNIVSSGILVNGIDLTLPTGNVIYVATTGNDSNAGLHEHNPVLTIKHALALATAGTTVYVYSGTYTEIFPLTIPVGVTLRGAGIRAVTIQPTVGTKSNDAFLLNGETTVEDLTLTGFLFNSGANTGYGFRFANNITVTTRSPYIRNITVLTRGSVTSSGDPYGFDQNDAGKGVLADGSVANASSKEASMLFHSVTFFTPNQETVTATNGVRIEWLNSFSYFADKGFYAYSSSTGFAGAGQTRLRIDTRVGTWAVGNTVTYYDTNGTTVLGTGTIASIDGNYVNLTGRQLGFQTITDRAGKIIYPQGDAKLSTAQKKFGPSSLLLDGTGDYLSIASQPDFRFTSSALRAQKTITVTGGAAVSSTQSKFGGGSISFGGSGDNILASSSSDFAYGTGDFTIEMWVYRTVSGVVQTIYDQRTGNSVSYCPVLNITGGNVITYNNGTSTVISGATTVPLNAWSHIAVSRSGTNTKLFLNGVQQGSTYVDSLTYIATPVRVGSRYDASPSSSFTGYIDEVRVSKGIARYTANFTPSASAFTADSYSTLLIHSDTTLVDDSGIQNIQDFCLETWVYNTGGQGAVQSIFDFRTTTTQVVPYLNIQVGGSLLYYVNGASAITGGSIPLNTWTHVALSRYGTYTKLFVNGTQVGSTYTDTNDYIQSPVTIGARYDGTLGFNGYIDDVRISTVARYTGNFTVPTQAFTGDLNTVLLLHFNGNNNSITILDDGITKQDIRTSAGGTAQLINFADYSDFGAEIRSIGSASIYGNYGVYGDGIGVIGYFVSHNVAYVGAGKLTTNDPNDRIGSHEFTQLNGAKIYHTSVDNEGNFSVGSNFSINQKTGDVNFNNQSLTITSLTGVTFTDGTHTTTVTSTDITTGNIKIHDNNIDSLTGDITITAASGAINLQNTTNVSGNLNVTGDVNIGGNITIGDASTDTVNFVGSIDSNLIPSTTAYYNIGTALLRWKTAFLNRVEIDNLVIDNNTIQTTNGNDDLVLIAAGLGKIYVPSNNVQIDQNLSVTQDLTVTTGTSYLKNTTVVGTITQTGDINQTGNFVTSGNTQVTGNITGTGYVQLPEIRISGNTISTTTTNRDLQLSPNGSGDVIFEGIKVTDNNIRSTATNSNITLVPQDTGGVIVNSNQSVQIPAGNNAQRPASPSNGMIRYNTQLNRYEGYSNGYWTKLGGIQDVDGNTYILAEATPGANDNTLYFYAGGTLTATIDSTKLFTTRFQTANLDLQNNTITPVLTNSDLNLTTTGSGGVRLGNFKIYNNTITNVVANAVTQFSETAGGYVKIAGTNGVVIPSGDGYLDRPLVPEVGMMRFNTDGNLVEVYNGVTWTSVAGTNSGVTAAEATEIGIASAIIFG